VSGTRRIRIPKTKQYPYPESIPRLRVRRQTNTNCKLNDPDNIREHLSGQTNETEMKTNVDLATCFVTTPGRIINRGCGRGRAGVLEGATHRGTRRNGSGPLTRRRCSFCVPRVSCEVPWMSFRGMPSLGKETNVYIDFSQCTKRHVALDGCSFLFFVCASSKPTVCQCN